MKGNDRFIGSQLTSTSDHSSVITYMRSMSSLDEMMPLDRSENISIPHRIIEDRIAKYESYIVFFSK